MDKATDAALADRLSALANPLRLRLVRRLQRPAFIPDLGKELGVSRQALKKHLDGLVAADLVVATLRRRGALPAMQYAADPAGLFALREMVSDLSLSDAAEALPRPTRILGSPGGGAAPQGQGLLMVHGDRPGRWFPLGRSAVVGRDAKADVPLPYDGYASGRHAMLRSEGGAWHVTDLHSTNGTSVNFSRLGRGASVAVAHGDILTIGRTHLALRAGP